jgi:predicted acetyltransferase
VNDDITIDIASEGDWDAIYSAMSLAFNEDGDEQSSQAERHVFEPERVLVARRRGDIVGTAGILTRRMAVPGATVPTAHVTMVAVAPTARRRGVLTRFMTQQFADMQAAGEPIAALWASEARIYQRFGYGLAARRISMTIDTLEVRMKEPTADPGSLRQAASSEVPKLLADLYGQVYPQRPGWSERHDGTWEYRLADPPGRRNGATQQQITLHEGRTGVDGYALWRVKSDWDGRGPRGEVRVLEVVALNDTAYRELWRFLLTMDLARSASAWLTAIDEPLQYLVNEPRRLGMEFGDSLWVRVVDLPAALTARLYAAPIDVVFEVTDDHLPANAGRWRLTAQPGAPASCVSTVDEPDLLCDIRALGAAYLGDAVFGALHAAGLIREIRPGALASAAAAFTWHRAPAGIEVF